MINIFKKKKKEASRLVGLDIALKVSSFVTGKEHLHYGLWEKLDVTLENLGKAQEAYTNLLFKYLPKKEPQKKLEILDIGGGAGENAKKLIERGHRVTIIVPSKILAEHAKINTNKKAEILITTFEDYIPKYNSFDLCLFAESFQYIPIKTALKKASILLKNNGEILIADCFRSIHCFPCNRPSLNDFLKDILSGAHRQVPPPEKLHSLPHDPCFLSFLNSP